MNLTDLPICISARWSPVIGDPSLMGWITVAAYCAASLLSVLALRRSTGRQRMFWLSLALVLTALAINKQLDLQSALTAAGRCIAQAQGWYAERRAVQIRVVLGILVVCFLIALALPWIMRAHLRQVCLALLGAALLLTFIAVRAASVHHVNQFLPHTPMNGTLELGGIALICINAIYTLRSRPKPPPS